MKEQVRGTDSVLNSYSSAGHKLDTNVTGLKSRWWGGCVLSGSSRGESISLTSSA